MKVAFEIVKIKNPENLNVILGHAHFIKTVEDLYETMAGSVPNIKFGIAFCEASGATLVRGEGNDKQLLDLAQENALAIGAGHSFIIFMRDAFPINMLNQIKQVPEVCRIFCATANAVSVVIAQHENGRGIMGVIDGASPSGVEKEADIAWRRELVRKIGYKLG